MCVATGGVSEFNSVIIEGDIALARSTDKFYVVFIVKIQIRSRSVEGEGSFKILSSNWDEQNGLFNVCCKVGLGLARGGEASGVGANVALEAIRASNFCWGVAW